MEIKWKSGYRSKISAEEAYKALEVIRKENNGSLTAASVCMAATDKSSPLNVEIFDCSKKKAAERYYEDRARLLIRSVVVRYDERPEIEARAYQIVTEAVNNKPVSMYKATRDVLQDPVYREQVLSDAIKELVSFRRKYAALSELAVVFHAVDKVAVSL